jgi:hypothetical protein
MLETSYKSKLPHGWSWPIGAEALSRGLEGVEGAAARPLRFSSYHIRSMFWRRLRNDDHPYQVLEVAYSRPFEQSEVEELSSRGERDQWEVRIDPVPSAKRAFVQACLVKTGLANVRLWLEESRRLKGQQGRGFCRVLFDGGYGQILIEQRLNDFDEPLRATCACPSVERGAG